MNKVKYTAGIIGVGRIGFTLGFDKKREQPASHAMALKENKRISLKYACDTNEEALNNWRHFNKNALTFNNVDGFLQKTSCDIIVISVNENAHFAICMKCIHKKPALIILEKPIALNIKEGLTLQEEATKYRVPILVNHERRFSRDYKIAKDYIKKIGSILSINAFLDTNIAVYDKEKDGTGEYSLLHDGTHLIDCILYLLEDTIAEENILHNLTITSKTVIKEVVKELSVHFESKKCNNINLILSGMSRYFGFELDIKGTEGRIRIGNGIFEFYKNASSTLYTGFYSLTKDKDIKRVKKTRYFSSMVENAVNFLDKKEPLRSTIGSGLNTLKIIEKIKDKIKGDN